jgi:hypothetical protein
MLKNVYLELAKPSFHSKHHSQEPVEHTPSSLHQAKVNVTELLPSCFVLALASSVSLRALSSVFFTVESVVWGSFMAPW